MRMIRQHFQRLLQRGAWDCCWRIGVESTVLSLLVGSLLLAFGVPDRDFPNWSMGIIFVAIILVAPPVETLLMQALPIFVARKLKASFRAQVIAGTVVFAAFHLTEGVATVISAGLVGGFYFSLAYAHWRSHSRWRAFAVTAGSHAIHNGIAFVLIVISGMSQ